MVFSKGAYAYNYIDSYFLHDRLPAVTASVFRGKKKNKYQVNWNSLMFFSLSLCPKLLSLFMKRRIV